MKTTTITTHLTEIPSEELMNTNGGIAPVLLVGWAFAKGFAAGAGAAGTVHLVVKAVDKATS